jgi:acyl-CoA thioesterase
MAEALEKSRSNRLGVYEVTVKNQKDELVALFKGMVFIKDTDWQLTMNNE